MSAEDLREILLAGTDLPRDSGDANPQNLRRTLLDDNTTSPRDGEDKRTREPNAMHLTGIEPLTGAEPLNVLLDIRTDLNKLLAVLTPPIKQPSEEFSGKNQELSENDIPQTQEQEQDSTHTSLGTWEEERSG